MGLTRSGSYIIQDGNISLCEEEIHCRPATRLHLSTIAPQEHPDQQLQSSSSNRRGVSMPMALVGPSARGRSTNTYSETTAMSAAAAGLGPMPYHAAAPASHSQHAILAAAAAAAAHGQGLGQGSAATTAAAGVYAAGANSMNGTSIHHPQQQPHHSNMSGSQQTAQEVQPDRPIGYGAFGVVW